MQLKSLLYLFVHFRNSSPYAATIIWLEKEFIYMRRVLKCPFTYEYDRVCSEVTLCDWRDVRVQLLTKWLYVLLLTVQLWIPCIFCREKHLDIWQPCRTNQSILNKQTKKGQFETDTSKLSIIKDQYGLLFLEV